MRGDCRMRIARREQRSGNFWRQRLSRIVADEVQASLELHAIDLDAYEVAIAQPADRSAGQRLWADMADARTGRDSGKTRVSDYRDVLAPRQVLERGSDLVGLFHAVPTGPQPASTTTSPASTACVATAT